MSTHNHEEWQLREVEDSPSTLYCAACGATVAVPACEESCHHRCPACRVGLVTHLPCDPHCHQHRSAAAHQKGEPAIMPATNAHAAHTPSENNTVLTKEDSPVTTSGKRSRLKRSLYRLSERITRETPLEEVVQEIAILNARAQVYLAEGQREVEARSR